MKRLSSNTMDKVVTLTTMQKDKEYIKGLKKFYKKLYKNGKTHLKD